MTRHEARLDEDASARLGELIQLARQHGHATEASMFVSNAIRILYCLAKGEAGLVMHTDDDTIAPMEGVGEAPVVTVLH